VIDVEAVSTNTGWDATAEVNAGQPDASRHNVRVTHADMERWGRGGAPEDLVRRAFEFLLEREPPQQILKSFDLSDVERYFPDFGEAMAR
jgi:hypothetical protein